MALCLRVVLGTVVMLIDALEKHSMCRVFFFFSGTLVLCMMFEWLMAVVVYVHYCRLCYVVINTCLTAVCDNIVADGSE